MCLHILGCVHLITGAVSVNISLHPFFMFVLDKCDLLCGPGAVNRVSIRDGVELDRLWLPSLLHVHSPEAPADTREEKYQDLGSKSCRELTAAEKRRRNHELDAADILVNGWMRVMRETNVTKMFTFRLPDLMAELRSAPPLLAMSGTATTSEKPITSFLSYNQIKSLVS